MAGTQPIQRIKNKKESVAVEKSLWQAFNSAIIQSDKRS